MTITNQLDCEDVGVALREGRPLRLARAYRVLYAQDNLNFRALELSNPAPLGHQILEAAGAKPVEDFSLFAILPDGEFEEVPLHEASQFIANLLHRAQFDRPYHRTLVGDV